MRSRADGCHALAMASMIGGRGPPEAVCRQGDSIQDTVIRLRKRRINPSGQGRYRTSVPGGTGAPGRWPGRRWGISRARAFPDRPRPARSGPRPDATRAGWGPRSRCRHSGSRRRFGPVRACSASGKIEACRKSPHDFQRSAGLAGPLRSAPTAGRVAGTVSRDGGSRSVDGSVAVRVRVARVRPDRGRRSAGVPGPPGRPSWDRAGWILAAADGPIVRAEASELELRRDRPDEAQKIDHSYVFQVRLSALARTRLRGDRGPTPGPAAACLGISLSTADRSRRQARSWLHAAMPGAGPMEKIDSS